jgi:hypothetical protein
MVTNGGGWTLVVHNPGSGGWIPGNPDLSPSYSYGTYQPDPVASSAFYMNFASFNFSEFLFATGDGTNWLVTPKESLYNTWCGDCGVNCPVTISASSCSAQPFTAQWCMRHQYAEDPWATLGDHGGGCGYDYGQNTLYGENGFYSSQYHISLKNNHQGANIFIRKTIATAPPEPTCPSGMVAYWKLDESSGTIASDSIGSHTGTLQGSPTWQPGKINNAIYSNANTGNWINVPNSNDWKFGSNNFTMEFWVKTNVTGRHIRFLASEPNHWQIATQYPGTTGVLEVRLDDQWGSERSGTKIITDGNWHQVVWTRAGDTMKVYVDDVIDMDFNVPAGWSIDVSSLNIGHQPNSGDGYDLNGYMDEVAIYNRTLTRQEIQQQYNSGVGSSYCEIECGNGVVNASAGEECDPPTTCTPTYGGSCQYCNSSCQYQTVQGGYCGDGTCQAGSESYSTCHADCGYCGDGTCQTAESHATCAQDCPLCPQGMVDYWKFDEGSGTTAIDSIGSNNGIINGGTWTTDSIAGGSAISLVNNNVDFGNSDSLKYLNVMTIEAWVKLNSCGPETAVISRKSRGDRPGGWAFQIDRCNPEVWAWDTGWEHTASGGGISTGEWHHVAWVHDSSTSTLYVDGVQSGDSAELGTILPNDFTMYTGAILSEPGGPYFNGNIDEVAVYNLALSATEIQTHYQNSLQGKEYCERAAAPPEEICNNNIDDDLDSLTDCADTVDCAADPACQAPPSGCPQGMISYWKFDANDARDYVSSNNGILEGATPTVGKVGQGMFFNGNVRIMVPHNSNLNPNTGQITFEGWINHYGDGPHDVMITKRGSFSDNPPESYQWNIYVQANNTFRIDLYLSPPGWYVASGSVTVPRNVWEHLATTYDGQDVKNYINGTLIETIHYPGTLDLRDTHPLYMGTDTFGSYFKGSMDEVAIYNRALSQSELQAHYQNGLQGKGYCEEATGSDMIPPETSIAISGASQVGGVYTSDVSVSLTATDNQGGSGVKETKYRIDNGEFITGISFPVSCALTCTSTVEYYSVDNNDNVESTKYASISIDKRAANETVTTSGGTVANEVGTATVTIPASAYSQSLSFVIAPSEQSFVPMAPGMTQIAQPLDLGPQCYLIDNEADCQSTAGCEFDYDTAACQSVRLQYPATITMPGDCTGAYGDLVTQKISKYTIDGWISLTTCDYNDMGGGIYSCTEGDGRVSTWDTNTCTITIQTYSFSPFIVTGYSMQYCSTQQISQEGTWAVNYDVTDTYGNEASGTSQQIKVDLYPPSSYAQFTGVAGEQGWYTSDVVVDFVASDSMSGVKAVYYSLDNETWNTWAGPDTLAFSEKSMLYYYSRDNAGHVEAVRTAFIAIDKTGPEISVTETGTAGTDPWWISILDVTINATDAESGMKELCSSLGVEAAECVQAQ